MSAKHNFAVDLADVSNQTVQLVDRFNQTFEVYLGDFDYYRKFAVISSIVYASQIGACLTVLIILLMLTKAEKRKSPVFILNSSALLFTVVGVILQCMYFTGPWYDSYRLLAGDYFQMPAWSKRLTAAPGAFSCLITIAVEASLVLQLKVVCVTLTPLQRTAITFVSSFVALTAIGFRIAQVAISTECIDRAGWCERYLWLFKAMSVTTTISICFFSCAFCAKLGVSLFQRRRMGLTQFGPMQIIFIGSFQTLIIPAIFAILQFAVDVPEIGSNVLTVTAISLPLSSLWASGSITKSSAGALGPDAHRKFIVSSTTGNSTSRNKSVGEAWGSGPSRPLSEKAGKIGVLSSVGSGSGTENTPRSGRFPAEVQVIRDLEMQELQGRR